jgi:hypothetical protein
VLCVALGAGLLVNEIRGGIDAFELVSHAVGVMGLAMVSFSVAVANFRRRPTGRTTILGYLLMFAGLACAFVRLGLGS